MLVTEESWRQHHPEWKHRRWNGADVEALFRRERPELLPTYLGYRHWVERADAARYLILWNQGGVYVDHDITAVASLEELTHASLVLAPTEPFGVSNDFLMAEPGDPLMGAVLDELPRAARTWGRWWIPPYVRIMLGTGPVLLTRVWRAKEAQVKPQLLTPAQYGHGDPEAALVRHEPGGTWHGRDGRLIWWLWTHRTAAAVLFILSVMGLASTCILWLTR